MSVVFVIREETKVMDRDHRCFKEVIRSLAGKNLSVVQPHRTIVEIGRLFLGVPYVPGTLEGRGSEGLVVNLTEFDCVTFVESILALTCCVKSGRKSFEAFRKQLLKMRYRRGKLSGYASRLHYFSDWVHDNQKKGIVKDITARLGGKPLRKTADFMTAHADLYPRLKEKVSFLRMKSVERTISQRKLYVLPKEILRKVEDRICDGDIIAIATKQEGIDVLHVGVAAKMGNRVHLLHASSKEGEVVFSKQTLYRYLMQNKARSGIMVARPTA